jgi:hypothetical protein
MRVVAGSQLQVTVLAFSSLVTTQCSMVSADGDGIWLRIGGAVAATGCFFAAQLLSSVHRSNPKAARAFFILSVFALFLPLVDGNLDYISGVDHRVEPTEDEITDGCRRGS